MEKGLRVLFLVFVGLAALGFSVAQAAEVVKIGSLYPRTGVLARVGVECLRGVDLARDVQNEKGGVLGKKIELAPGDAVDAKRSLTEAERLITVEKVKIILGTMSSSCAYAASEAAEKHGALYWETHAVADNITARGFKYVFRMTPPSSVYGKIHVRFAKDVGAQSVAIIGEDSLFGSTVVQFASQEAKATGMKVVYEQLYNAASLDSSAMVLKLKAAKADHVIGVFYGPDALLFTKQMRELDCNVPSFIGTGAGHNLPDFINSLGNDGNYFGAAYGWNSDFKAPGVEEFVKRYQQKFGQKPYGHDAGQGYNGVMVLFRLIEKAKSFEPEAIRKIALETTLPESMTGFAVKFNSVGQNTEAGLGIGQWQNKEMYTVWPKNVATKAFIRPMPTWDKR